MASSVLSIEATVKLAEPDDAPATHMQVVGEAHWRRGKTGFAEINPGAGNPRYMQEWIVTGWRNEALANHPFRNITSHDLLRR